MRSYVTSQQAWRLVPSLRSSNRRVFGSNNGANVRASAQDSTFYGI